MSTFLSASRRPHMSLDTWRRLQLAHSRTRLRSAADVVAILLCELRRAVAAEQRYEDLKRTSPWVLARSGIIAADVPQCIFEEFYAFRVGAQPE